MEERARGEPRKYRCVFNGSPSPVTPPAALDVRPPQTQYDAGGDEEPCDQCPVANRFQRLLVHVAPDQRRGAKRERNRRTRIAQEQARRMNHHYWVLQDGIHAASVERDPVESLEWVGAEAQHGEEQDHHQRERPSYVRHHPAVAAAAQVNRKRPVRCQDQGPEEQRTFAPCPECAEDVNPWQVRARVRCNVREREFVCEESGP